MHKHKLTQFTHNSFYILPPASFPFFLPLSSAQSTPLTFSGGSSSKKSGNAADRPMPTTLAEVSQQYNTVLLLKIQYNLLKVCQIFRGKYFPAARIFYSIYNVTFHDKTMHSALTTDFELRPPLTTTTFNCCSSKFEVSSQCSHGDMSKNTLGLPVLKFYRKCNETLPHTLHEEVRILTVY